MGHFQPDRNVAAFREAQCLVTRAPAGRLEPSRADEGFAGVGRVVCDRALGSQTASGGTGAKDGEVGSASVAGSDDLGDPVQISVMLVQSDGRRFFASA